MPLFILLFWTVFNLIVFITSDFPNLAMIIFVTITNLILWLIYFLIKPWKLKYLYKNENNFICKVNGNARVISSRAVKRIYPIVFSKYSPIIIEFNSDGKNEKIAFIPRQSNVILLLPFFKHPITDELIEEIKTVTNTWQA